MKTVNQINARQRRVFSFYKEIQETRNDKTRYFKFKRYQDRPSREEPQTNFVLSTLLKECEAAGYEGDFYKHINTEIDGYNVYFRYECSIHDGVYIQILSSDINIFSVREKIYIKSHKRPQKIDPLAYLQKEAEKRLFAPGFFRDIQIYNNQTKKQAINSYKDWLKFGKERLFNPVNKQEQIEISLKKRLKKANILLDKNEIYTERELRRAMNIGRIKTRKILAIAPSPWDVYEEAVSNFDTEDEIMQYAEEVYCKASDKYILI